MVRGEPVRRNAGLDVLRCCAILPVVVYHTPIASTPLEQWGFMGVEVFFTLSGFLIAQMIAERFDGIGSAQALRAFLANRWVRTLPLYFLFLGANVWLTQHHDVVNPTGAAAMGEFSTMPDLPPYLLMAQNLWTGGGALHRTWFGVSWTLTVEEWIYLVLPLGLYAGHRLGWTFQTTLVRVALALIGLALVLRVGRHLSVDTADYEDMFRRPVLMRFDALSYGALAYVAMQRFGDMAYRYRGHLALLGIGLLAPVLANHPTGGDTGFFCHVLSWPLATLAVALTLPAVVHAEVSSRAVMLATRFVSTRTYALYLSHTLVAYAFAGQIAAITTATLLPLLALQLLTADLVYRGLERPILRLRPNSAARAAPARSSVAVSSGAAAMAGA